MRVGTVCSGIEAPTMAWSPLGWETKWTSEIEPFPCALLDYLHPGSPNLGDMTEVDWRDVEPIDIFMGGTPCQSFSVAGLRAGLADSRGNLALEFFRVVDILRPRWVVWENVPGVLSSDGGRAFGAMLGALEELGYGFAWRVLDAQYFGVPQRRRRVFLVAHSGGVAGPRAVLLESESLLGNPPPSREARQEASGDTAGGFREPMLTNPEGSDGATLTLSNLGKTLNNQTPLVVGFNWQNWTKDGLAITEHATGPLDRSQVKAVAYDTTQITHRENRSNPKPGDPCHPLAAGAHPPLAIGFRPGQSAQSRNVSEGIEVAGTVEAGGGGNNRQAVAVGPEVRRLTPVECERLQGFPDDYTRIPWDVYKLAAKRECTLADVLRDRGQEFWDKAIENCPMTPRYRALGNSIAVPCLRWIGRRIKLVEELL